MKILPDPVYNVLKWIVCIVLPAVAGIYGELGPYWGWYNPDLIVLTITKVATFLGVILGISCYNYAKAGGHDGGED